MTVEPTLEYIVCMSSCADIETYWKVTLPENLDERQEIWDSIDGWRHGAGAAGVPAYTDSEEDRQHLATCAIEHYGDIGLEPKDMGTDINWRDESNSYTVVESYPRGLISPRGWQNIMRANAGEDPLAALFRTLQLAWPVELYDGAGI